MRSWLHEVDDGHERMVHAVDASDINALADYCAGQRALGAGNGKDDKLCMHADGWTIMAWCNKVGLSWQQFWADPDAATRFIEDPDNAAFRVWEGKL